MPWSSLSRSPALRGCTAADGGQSAAATVAAPAAGCGVPAVLYVPSLSRKSVHRCETDEAPLAPPPLVCTPTLNHIVSLCHDTCCGGRSLRCRRWHGWACLRGRGAPRARGTPAGLAAGARLCGSGCWGSQPQLSWQGRARATTSRIRLAVRALCRSGWVSEISDCG